MGAVRGPECQLDIRRSHGRIKHVIDPSSHMFCESSFPYTERMMLDVKPQMYLEVSCYGEKEFGSVGI